MIRRAGAPVVGLALLLSSACEPVPVTLRIERPTVAELDPTLDDFVTEASLVITDEETDRVFETDFDLEPPVRLDLEDIPWGDRIRVEVIPKNSTSGKMAGYGRAVAAITEGSEVTIPVRKLLAYVADRDEDDDEVNGLGMPLRALDVGPEDTTQLDYLPNILESYDVNGPNGIYVTSDGRHLVVGGAALGVEPRDATSGLITVFSTSDHEVVAELPTPSRVAGLAPFSGTGSALVALYDTNRAMLLDESDWSLREIQLFNDQNGGASLDVGGLGAAPGARVAYIVGRMRGQAAPRVPRIYRVDVDADPIDVTVADGEQDRSFEDVRVRGDGEELFVLEYGGGDGSDAFIEVRDPTTLQLTERVPLQQDPAKPFQLFLNPNGAHLHVQRDVIYNPGCCGGTEVLDMLSHEWVFNDDDVSIASATGLPDGRMIGGLSHFSNDSGGQLIWINSPTELGAKIRVDVYVGHVFAMAAPFADRL